MQSSPAIGPAARQGFWAVIVLSGLLLAAAYVSPIAAGSSALILLAFAWGIRRGHAWAALAAIVHLLAPIAPALRADWKAVGITVLVEAVFVFFLIRAARELWRDPARRRPWPWAAAAVLAGIFWLTCYPYAVSAGSMQKTLQPGDRILVESATWMLGRSPSLGDVVVVRYPLDRRQLFIKRVVAGPGDRIHLREKQLYRNGEAVTEPYAVHTASGVDLFRDNFPAPPTLRLATEAEEMLRYHVRDGELVVPEGKYFVLGDNRDDSLDSRFWGFVTRLQIVGTPVLIYDSYESGSVAPSHVRWKRLLTMIR
jgi:signal peptidase I